MSISFREATERFFQDETLKGDMQEKLGSALFPPGAGSALFQTYRRLIIDMAAARMIPNQESSPPLDETARTLASLVVEEKSIGIQEATQRVRDLRSFIDNKLTEFGVPSRSLS
jgi:hypothetical protein